MVNSGVTVGVVQDMVGSTGRSLQDIVRGTDIIRVQILEHSKRLAIIVLRSWG